MFSQAKIKPLVASEFRFVSGPQAGETGWKFNGLVPATLCYECNANDPETLDYLLRAAAQSGPGIAKKIAERQGLRFANRYFGSEEAALSAAAAIGARVTQVCPLDISKWRTLVVEG